jgi:hypothetical protein
MRNASRGRAARMAQFGFSGNVRRCGEKMQLKFRLALVTKKNQATICSQQVHRRQNVANKRLSNLNWKW